MTTNHDHAAKAAIDYLGPCPLPNGERAYQRDINELAAIIHRHYEPHMRLLERAVAVLRDTEDDALEQMRADAPGVAPDWYSDVRDWIADAAAMGIGRMPE